MTFRPLNLLVDGMESIFSEVEKILVASDNIFFATKSGISVDEKTIGETPAGLLATATDELEYTTYRKIYHISTDWHCGWTSVRRTTHHRRRHHYQRPDRQFLFPFAAGGSEDGASRGRRSERDPGRAAPWRTLCNGGEEKQAKGSDWDLTQAEALR
jgi:hypothetical protein